MTLVERIKEAEADISAKRSGDATLRELLAFYREKQREGAVLKRTYDLPPVDTIGKTAHRAK